MRFGIKFSLGVKQIPRKLTDPFIHQQESYTWPWGLLLRKNKGVYKFQQTANLWPSVFNNGKYNNNTVKHMLKSFEMLLHRQGDSTLVWSIPYDMVYMWHSWLLGPFKLQALCSDWCTLNINYTMVKGLCYTVKGDSNDDQPSVNFKCNSLLSLDLHKNSEFQLNV